MDLYKHLKTDCLYEVIGRGLLATNGNPDEDKSHVIYRNTKSGMIFIRLASEFDDGRFALATPAPVQKG